MTSQLPLRPAAPRPVLLLLALGGVAAGSIAMGAVAIGLLAWGGVSLGWLSVGGVAKGTFALGGVAAGSKVAIGGVASAPVAIGAAVEGVQTFPIPEGGLSGGQLDMALNAVRTASQGAPSWLCHLLELFITYC